MYSGILKNMGGKGGSNKEQKLHQKQQSNLPSDEIVDLKNSLLMFNKSMKKFIGGAHEASCTIFQYYNAFICSWWFSSNNNRFVQLLAHEKLPKDYMRGWEKFWILWEPLLINIRPCLRQKCFLRFKCWCYIFRVRSHDTEKTKVCLPLELTDLLLTAFRDSADCVTEINRLINQLALHFSRRLAVILKFHLWSSILARINFCSSFSSVSQYLIQLKESNKITKSIDKVQVI